MLLRDRVNLIRKNGDRIDDIRASVQGNKILVRDTSIQMDEGDTLTRKLQNGLEEKYLILNLNYHDRKSTGYISIDVQKETKIQNPKKTHLEYNQYGNVGQLNIDSSDASQIIVITEDNIFEQLNKTVDSTVPNANEKAKLLDQIEDLKNTHGQKGFLEKYNSFISSAANHVALWAALSPFISILTGMFRK